MKRHSLTDLQNRQSDCRLSRQMAYARTGGEARPACPEVDLRKRTRACWPRSRRVDRQLTRRRMTDSRKPKSESEKQSRPNVRLHGTVVDRVVDISTGRPKSLPRRRQSSQSHARKSTVCVGRDVDPRMGACLTPLDSVRHAAHPLPVARCIR